MATITLTELSTVFSRIIDKLEYEGYSTVNLIDDFYKYIPADEWDNLDKDVVELGSLYDDIDSLKKLSSENNRICTYVDFDRIASVLRAISQAHNLPF